MRDVEVVDIVPFGVAFDWEKVGEPPSTGLFEQNCPIACMEGLLQMNQA